MVAASLTGQLYESLLDGFTPEASLQKLKGRTVALGYRASTLGTVTDVRGRVIDYEPHTLLSRSVPGATPVEAGPHHSNAKIEADAIYVDSSGFQYIAKNKPGYPTMVPRVITTKPRSIYFPAGKNRVNFVEKDPALDRYLTELMSDRYFPATTPTHAVKTLTTSIHEMFPFVRGERNEETENRMPLGTVLASSIDGLVCRHLAALEFAVLQLKGFKPHYVTSEHTINQIGHEFLEVEVDGATFVVDPTWGVAGPKERVLTQLREEGYSVDFHKVYRRRRAVPTWRTYDERHLGDVGITAF